MWPGKTIPTASFCVSVETESVETATICIITGALKQYIVEDNAPQVVVRSLDYLVSRFAQQEVRISLIGNGDMAPYDVSVEDFSFPLNASLVANIRDADPTEEDPETQNLMRDPGTPETHTFDVIDLTGDGDDDSNSPQAPPYSPLSTNPTEFDITRADGSGSSRKRFRDE